MPVTKKERAEAARAQALYLASRYRELATSLSSYADVLQSYGSVHSAAPTVSTDTFVHLIEQAAKLHHIIDGR